MPPDIPPSVRRCIKLAPSGDHPSERPSRVPGGSTSARGRPLPSAAVISTNQFRNGTHIEVDGTIYRIMEFQHVKPGKGGAFVRSKLRNLRTGSVLERTFNAGVRVEQALLDKKDMQFLYRDGDEYVFMDTESYEQQNVKPVALGDAADYLVEQAVAQIAFYNGEIVTVEIPAAVELTITDTDPGVQGDRVSGARKPATLQTGKVLQVPLFINPGDRVRVDTRSGEYITRV
jgi:elongation factor P